MFVAITNTPRPYAWGSHTAIAELLGRPESGGPEAELWLGAHEGSPSTILDPTQTGGAPDLATWIAEDPDVALGSHAPGGRLPFLLKILAAASPLSLQAHPTAEQARAGFARENAEHIPLGAPHRNYKDAYPKPELIYALSEPFDALCGFRPPETVNAIVGELRSRASTQNDVAAIDDFAQRAGALPELVEWLSSGGPAVEVLVATVTGLAAASDTRFPLEFATVTTLAADYPGDPGVVISLLLNRVALRRGEVLYLPAGNIHAYLFGLGVELMTASDNVLRGGLTPKHIDVPELLSVLDFTPVPVPYLTAERPAPGVSVFRPSVADFVLVHFDGTGSYALDGPAIAICVSGTAQLSGTAQRGGTAQLGGSAAVRTEGGAGGGGGAAAGGAGGGAAAVFGGGEAVGGGGGGAGGGAAGGGGGGGAASVFGGGESSGTSAVLRRGESVYITPDEGVISVSGGEVFLATTGR